MLQRVATYICSHYNKNLDCPDTAHPILTCEFGRLNMASCSYTNEMHLAELLSCNVGRDKQITTSFSHQTSLNIAQLKSKFLQNSANLQEMVRIEFVDVLKSKKCTLEMNVIDNNLVFHALSESVSKYCKIAFVDCCHDPTDPIRNDFQIQFYSRITSFTNLDSHISLFISSLRWYEDKGLVTDDCLLDNLNVIIDRVTYVKEERYSLQDEDNFLVVITHNRRLYKDDYGYSVHVQIKDNTPDLYKYDVDNLTRHLKSKLFSKALAISTLK
ncbi:hypothetical protein AKO1_006517 [Acrasis kona]|uniref:Uncharacterized protein n=1 Tax=Acrasis kona TaxID=1008807 RepID=A0AAW2ZLH7_9EUKA